jgi:hypothetical protein
MLRRCLLQKPVLVALVVLAMNVAPQARAEEHPLFHLDYAAYEVREAKEDVRFLKDYPAGRKKELLGALEDTLTTLKAAYKEATGKDLPWHKPDPGDHKNWRHLRNAVKMLKQSKDQIKKEKGLSVATQDKVIKKMKSCIDLLEKALDHVK